MRWSLIVLVGLPFLILACAGTTSEHVPDEAAAQSNPGEALFNLQCTLCHGNDGTLQISGAKDLSKSSIERDEVLAVIRNGRGAMIAYKDQLSDKEMELVADHVLSLRK